METTRTSAGFTGQVRATTTRTAPGPVIQGVRQDLAGPGWDPVPFRALPRDGHGGRAVASGNL